MNIKRLHYLSGLTLLVFISLHLFNHAMSIFGPETYTWLMDMLRVFYRNTFVEVVLLLAVLTQIISGIKLFWKKRVGTTAPWDKLQIWTGLYLALFLLIHIAAIFAGRYILQLDTNFYFGAAGLNSFPVNLFFIPYYALAILSIFGHLSAVHNRKMKQKILGLPPAKQARIILLVGVALMLVIFYGFTNHFKGLTIPKEYKVLVGK